MNLQTIFVLLFSEFITIKIARLFNISIDIIRYSYDSSDIELNTSVVVNSKIYPYKEARLYLRSLKRL